MNKPTIQEAMSELLAALGFEAMAADVKGEFDNSRLGRYARVIVKNSPRDKQLGLTNHFRMLRLL